MSNASLKEQLQALSLGPSTDSAEKNKKPQKPNHPHKQNHSQKNSAKPNPTKQKPAWLEYAQYGVELLKAHFPNCFKDIKETQPLKVGIKQDLAKIISTRTEIVIGDKACMVSSLAYYVNSLAYLKNMVAGAHRIDLDGNQAGLVTPEEAQYSVDSRKAKLLKKKPAAPAPAAAQAPVSEVTG
jgi:sRNA-binding protein